MNDSPADEEVDAGNDLSVAIVYGRQWPKYLAHWSIRRRVADRDFPLVSGHVEALPSAHGSTEDIWISLREQALEQARAADPGPATDPKSGSFLARLFRRG